MKRLIALFSCLLIFSFSGCYLGQDSDFLKGSVKVNVSPELAETIESSVLDDIINDLVESNPDASAINLNDVAIAETTPDQTRYQWYDLWISWKTTKTRTISNILAKTSFVCSVAKGETYQLSSTWEQSLSASISGTYYASFSLSSTIKKTYTKSYTFSGPPESSSYNSRLYYVKFYEHRGNWAQEVKGWPSNHISYYSGTYKEPSYYASYSVDRSY
ncbi:MAG: hypothetical protein JXJ04_26720 [Spirochaetales bacterium]|nr:hypothetical protein [Spirochaetales bacterium]